MRETLFPPVVVLIRYFHIIHTAYLSLACAVRSRQHQRESISDVFRNDDVMAEAKGERDDSTREQTQNKSKKMNL